MRLNELYISETEKSRNPSSTNTVITDEAYAVCEFLEKLITQVERANLLRGK